jgi:hypothetical protein
MLVASLVAGYAYAAPKDVRGKQVRYPDHRLGTVVGRSEGGFIIIPATHKGTRQLAGEPVADLR